MSVGSNAATNIVTNNTSDLIAKANSIVLTCVGTNCNTSDATRTSITQSLSLLAQQQSMNTLSLLSIPISSVIGRQIYQAYLELAAAIASVYNFQCGNTIVTSTICVPAATSVQQAQNNLEALLVQPSTDEINHVATLSILAVIVVISFILFFIFLIIGLIGRIFEPVQPIYVQRIITPQIIPIPESTAINIPMPVSPYQ